MLRAPLIGVVCALPSLGWAAEVPAGPGAGDLLRVLLALAAVVGVIVVIAAFVRSSGRLPGSSARMLRLVDSMPLGAKEKLVVVDAGTTRLVLGVAPGSVQALHVLPDGASLAEALASDAADAGLVGFAGRLRSALATQAAVGERVS